MGFNVLFFPIYTHAHTHIGIHRLRYTHTHSHIGTHTHSASWMNIDINCIICPFLFEILSASINIF